MWTVEDIAARPRWSIEELAQLGGNCRGVLLKDWASNVRRRWGDNAVAQIREAMGPLQELLPEQPNDNTWYPVVLQIRLTDVIIEQFLDGDAMTLEPLLHEDSLRENGDKARSFVSRMGPQILLRMFKRFHTYLYDVGSATPKVGWGKASILTEGSPLFSNPTWQLIHLFALRGLFQLANKNNTTLSLQQFTSERIETNLRW